MKAEGTSHSHIYVGVLLSRNHHHIFYAGGKTARLYREMILWGKKKDIVIFFFHPLDIAWRRKKIKGITLNKNDRWVSKYFDFPLIIYNRLSYRSDEKKAYIQNILKKLAHENIFIFNTRFLNKWEIYQTLKDYPHIAPFLPRTSLFSKSALRDFTSLYNDVFLKPQNNSRGKGIIKITKHPYQNGFIFACADQKPLRWIPCHSYKDLYLKLRKYILYPKSYLLQEGIRLARYKGRVFDLRTQIQKDGNGEWTLTGIGVRVAHPERFVTHIPNGGKAASLEEVISLVWGREKLKNIKTDITFLCDHVPQILEKDLNLNLAILSLDIGVDEEGSTYILEVNSKPASFDEEHIRQKHLELLTDYFIFAANSISKRKAC
ncbi:YheC/D like ATP-grasp [Thermosyntropha lipolytica DSM 11003]|uniref:YheC/D like ATP-grasp n=1 Tax=Thermosyntropha lipolytica DSM 11003 TaxID=1123382 RepID=A0A1M5LCI8_9FIRM|nr:YheC/YheD family protein [Thermosyntropha lipolytica]SHG62429.1 YheC/D like ATP-grasp [Thermosyntropha lipolytica DSM 11003]